MIFNFLDKCKITKIEKCDGEAVANNRKGKLIFFYEWNIILNWKCQNEDLNKIEGKINIPNLSEENDISEVDVSNFYYYINSKNVCVLIFFNKPNLSFFYIKIEITLKDSTDEGEKVKHFLHTKGKATIREKLKKYVTSLKEGKLIKIIYII